jgi:hypothetical protein
MTENQQQKRDQQDGQQEHGPQDGLNQSSREQPSSEQPSMQSAKPLSSAPPSADHPSSTENGFHPSPWLNGLIQLFWIKPALWGRYVSRTMPMNILDGIQLTVWPKIAAFVPLVVLLIGLLFGWAQLGFESIYSESFVFLLIAIMIGFFSANLGLMFLVGFVFGEFFLALDWTSTLTWRHDTVWENILYFRIPLIMTYGLLAGLIVKVPVLIKHLLVQVRPPQGLGSQVQLGFMMIGHALVTTFLVYFWMQVMPVLVRPVFTWSSRNPPVEAIETFQVYGVWLIVAAIVSSAARLYLQHRTTYHPYCRSRLEQVEQQLQHTFASVNEVKPWAERFTPWGRTIALSALLTLLLSGLYASWLDALILGTFIFVLQAARMRLIPVPLGKWPQWMERIPLLYRLVFSFLIILFLTRTVLNHYFSSWGSTSQESFTPVIVLTGLSMLIVFLLNPGTAEHKQEARQPAAQGGHAV